MVTKRAKQAVKAAAEAKVEEVVVAKKAGKVVKGNVVKKVSYGTGALCKKVKGKVSGLSKAAGLRKAADSEPWKKVLKVTESFCEKVSETTADVYGKVTEIVKKSTADMTDSFKAGMTSVKPERGAAKAAATTVAKAKSKVKGARKTKSRLEKFVKDVDVAPAAEVEAPVEAPAAEEAVKVEQVSPSNAELEQEIAQITEEVKEA
ncbi:MAG: hypothetical protein WCO69_00305 [Candidatus Omnitrophota bacterium]